MRIKLIIERSKKRTGYRGVGPKFLLRCKLELTKEEQQLIDDNGGLAHVLKKVGAWEGNILHDLQNGRYLEYSDDHLAGVWATEAKLKTDLAQLRPYLQAASDFSGSQEIEL